MIRNSEKRRLFGRRGLLKKKRLVEKKDIRLMCDLDGVSFQIGLHWIFLRIVFNCSIMIIECMVLQCIGLVASGY